MAIPTETMWVLEVVVSSGLPPWSVCVLSGIFYFGGWPPRRGSHCCDLVKNRAPHTDPIWPRDRNAAWPLFWSSQFSSAVGWQESGSPELCARPSLSYLFCYGVSCGFRLRRSCCDCQISVFGRGCGWARGGCHYRGFALGYF